MGIESTDHGASAAWREALDHQLGDELDRIRLLLRRRAAWLRFRDGRAPLEGAIPGAVTEAQVSSALRLPGLAAEAEFNRGDPEAVRTGEAARSLAAQIRERSAAMEAAGTPFPLDRVIRLFGLDDAAADVLRLALAPELDAGFERAYAYVHDDASRRWATPALVAALSGGGGAYHDRVLAATIPSGPLFRWALLCPADEHVSAAVQPLRLERRLVWYLRGVECLEPGVDPVLRPLDRTPACEEVTSLARLVVARMEGSARRPVVNAMGGTVGEAAVFAAAVARELGMDARRTDVDPTREREAWLARLDREAALQNALLFLQADEDGARALDADPVLDAVDRLAAPVVLWSRDPPRLERGVVSVNTPRTEPDSARAVWRASLAGADAPSEDALDRIVHHFDLDPSQILRTATAARGAARLRGERVSDADLWSACRIHGRRRLGTLAQRTEPCFVWDDIVLADDVLRQLREITEQVRHRALVYERWRFGEKLARGRGVTALFSGPSGTGKTMAAEIVAGELELDLYRIDLAGIVSKYIGETEKNLRGIFEAAEESGAVLFFDEADALFGKRTDIRDSHDRYANIEVDYLLQRMESYRGLAILATNRRAALDRAFLRRLRFLVEFPFPSADVRLRIWQRVLPATAPTRGLDFPALARMELSGGNIRGIALNAAFLAAADGKVITMEHLGHAAAREYAKLDKAPDPAGRDERVRRGAT